MKAYAKDELIGFLTGKLAPVGTFQDGWVLDVVREDLNEETVCQVHCANVGNYLRLLNHSCKPSARFSFRKVSGKYRVMVLASRDIYDGEEVTVGYGKEYLSGMRCLCEVHNPA